MSNLSGSCKCQIALAGIAEGLEHLEGCWMEKGGRQEEVGGRNKEDFIFQIHFPAVPAHYPGETRTGLAPLPPSAGKTSFLPD